MDIFLEWSTGHSSLFSALRSPSTRLPQGQERFRRWGEQGAGKTRETGRGCACSNWTEPTGTGGRGVDPECCKGASGGFPVAMAEGLARTDSEQVVQPAGAESTGRPTAWESRTLPDPSSPLQKAGGVFCGLPAPGMGKPDPGEPRAQTEPQGAPSHGLDP